MKERQKINGHVTAADYECFEEFGEAPLITAVLTYMSFLFLNILGRFRDLLQAVGLLNLSIEVEPPETESFVPLYSSYEAFYTRNLYRRIQDCWNRPICSPPSSEMVVMDRVSDDHWWTSKFSGQRSRVINLGSYNYLGFGSPEGSPRLAVEESCRRYAIGLSSSRQEAGSIELHRELETLVAEFLGHEEAICFGMGFATNSLNLPCLVDKNCLVLSDEHNHTSLILGCRLSGATIMTFKHNNLVDLERLLEEAVVYGQPRKYRPYKKIIILVEGVYSMEGSIVHLPQIIALKHKYKAYIYLDEAHSIGAVGPNGRGVCDYYGINPKQIDILMGTFTKGFGSAGGYIAGSKRLIDYMRTTSHAGIYGSAMAAPVAQQIVSTMRIIMGLQDEGQGQARIDRLAWNTRYFRARLHNMGLLVYGNRDSPVVPVIICMPAKLAAFSRRCLQLGLGVVVVGFPATRLLLSRVRFCISAAHSRQQLDRALAIIEQVASELSISYSSNPTPEWARKLLAVEWSTSKKSNGSSLLPKANGFYLHHRHQVPSKPICNGHGKLPLANGYSLMLANGVAAKSVCE